MEWAQLGHAQHLERPGLGERTGRRPEAEGGARVHCDSDGHEHHAVAIGTSVKPPATAGESATRWLQPAASRAARVVACLLALTFATSADATAHVRRGNAARGAAADTAPGRPHFRLGPTPAVRQASGKVELSPAQSPFGVATTRDGRLVFDLDITVTDLPAPSDLGPYVHYEAWLTTPKLDLVHDLGPIENNKPVHAQADWNKFTIIVSAEGAPVGHKWTSAIALIGRSPSSLMQSFANHPLFSVPEPD